jgi:hypothetical protein
VQPADAIRNLLLQDEHPAATGIGVGGGGGGEGGGAGPGAEGIGPGNTGVATHGHTTALDQLHTPNDSSNSVPVAQSKFPMAAPDTHM